MLKHVHDFTIPNFSEGLLIGNICFVAILTFRFKITWNITIVKNIQVIEKDLSRKIKSCQFCKMFKHAKAETQSAWWKKLRVLIWVGYCKEIFLYLFLRWVCIFINIFHNAWHFWDRIPLWNLEWLQTHGPLPQSFNC